MEHRHLIFIECTDGNLVAYDRHNREEYAYVERKTNGWGAFQRDSSTLKLIPSDLSRVTFERLEDAKDAVTESFIWDSSTP